MNDQHLKCKPDGVAMVVHPSGFGKIVKTLYLHPTGRHRLPDGLLHKTERHDCWVCESMGTQFKLPEPAAFEYSSIAVIRDAYLVPLDDEACLEIALTSQEAE